MATANVARRHGDDFQARLFRLKAASLLDPPSPIISVAYERGPKGFDDIRVEFDPDRARRDHEGKPIYKEHIQCKWHTTAGSFGYEDLINPDFINANRFSLLQRAHDAQKNHALDGLGCPFKLLINWRLTKDDPLQDLVRKESDSIDLEGWTKHPSHLAREFGRKKWGDEGYAEEELVAELGAALLCADLELFLTPREDHASYIAHWLTVLKNDKRAIFPASAHAQRAADFLHGLQPPAHREAA